MRRLAHDPDFFAMTQETPKLVSLCCLACLAIPLAVSYCSPPAPPELPEIRLAENGSIQVVNLDPAVTQAVRQGVVRDDEWRQFYTVSTAEESTAEESTAEESTSDRPPMLGTYRVERRVLLFEPRFPLAPGMTYEARFDGTALAQQLGDRLSEDQLSEERLPGRLVWRFQIPAAAGKPARVVAIYPTAPEVPENLLRFYIHFSAPMSRGEAWQRLHLQRFQEGRMVDVEAPFVEIEQELWDDAQQRLTVLFDPGRIKRGLRPHNEAGPPLIAGNRYLLVVDGEWLDARGQPLAASFEHAFQVVAADRSLPKTDDWQLTAPAAGTTDPVVLSFPAPLDHGLLQRLLRVLGAGGEAFPGQAEVGEEELSWQWRPERPWTAGDYSVEVDTVLEDLAGNSLRSVFDVDLGQPVPAGVEAETVLLPFTVD